MRLKPTTREATAMRSLHTTMKSSPRSRQLEKARAQQERPNAARSKQTYLFIYLLKKKKAEGSIWFPTSGGQPAGREIFLTSPLE